MLRRVLAVGRAGAWAPPMATAAAQPLTLAEFLEWDDGTDTRYELARSDLVVMAVVRARHSRIVGNLARYRGGPLQPVLPPER